MKETRATDMQQSKMCWRAVFKDTTYKFPQITKTSFNCAKCYTQILNNNDLQWSMKILEDNTLKIMRYYEWRTADSSKNKI